MTLAAYQHEEVFGVRVNDQVNLNEIGQVVAFIWQDLARHFPISLDEWILMPDHLHAILFLENRDGLEERGTAGQAFGTLSGSLGAIIQNFKAVTTRKVNRIRHTPGAPVWQRNYYEHVIRSEAEYGNICRYIAENPIRHDLRETADYEG